MELSDNDIDKLFRDNLSDLNLNFNPKDWNNMQRKMRAKKWRKFILLGLLALISTSLIAYLFITNLPTKNNLTNNANTTKTNTVNQTTNTINETSALNNEINNSNEISKEDINTNSENKNALNSANSFINDASHNVNNSSRNSVNTGTNNTFKEEQKLNNEQGKNSTKQNTNLLGEEAKNISNSLNSKTTSNEDTDNNNTVSNNSVDTDNSSNIFNSTQNNLEENSGKTLVNNSNNKPLDEENLIGNINNKINSVSDSVNLIKFTSSVLDESISLTLDTTLNSLQKMKDTVVWKHAFGLELYPNLNNYIGYNLGYSESSALLLNYSIESKTLKNIDFGFNYSFLRKKKIDISTGIHYTRIGYKVLYNDNGFKYTETTKFNFVDIRLDLNYHFNRKKISPYLSLAPELNALLNSNRETYFPNTKERRIEYPEAQNISASINLGAGVNYSLSKKWEMYLQINLKTFMFPTVSSTTFLGANGEFLTPQSYGFKLGIRRNSYKTIQIPVN